MILMDSESGVAMNLGESFVLENGGTRLSTSSRDLLIGGRVNRHRRTLPPDDHFISAEREVGDVFRAIFGDNQNVMLAVAAGP